MNGENTTVSMIVMQITQTARDDNLNLAIIDPSIPHHNQSHHVSFLSFYPV